MKRNRVAVGYCTSENVKLGLILFDKVTWVHEWSEELGFSLSDKEKYIHNPHREWRTAFEYCLMFRDLEPWGSS